MSLRTVTINGHRFVVEPGEPVATGPTVRIRPLRGRPSLQVITGLNKAQRRQKQIEAILQAGAA